MSTKNQNASRLTGDNLLKVELGGGEGSSIIEQDAIKLVACKYTKK